jgi:hypothetical protein
MRRLPLLPLLITAACAVLTPATSAVLAPAAHAASLEVGMADDLVLTWGGPDADRAIDQWRRLGVDVVRIHASWGAISPAPNDETMPAGFDPADPASPGYDWARLDAAVARVTAAGMRPMLTITGPGPLWGSQYPGVGDHSWKPSPARFAAFATAVALRYGASVDRYIVWNEPNQPAWLMPQYSCRGRSCTPVAPHLYRALVRAAEPAIHAADPASQVLIGALAPTGQAPRRPNAVMAPLRFLREMGCVDARFRTIRTGPCRHFRPAHGDGFSIHPHAATMPPTVAYRSPDDVNLADLDRLESTLDRLQSHRRLRASTRRFDLYLTEYGYQTQPPDKLLGVSLTRQDRWLQEGAYLASRDPRVRNLTQYVWRDEPVGPGGRYPGWQSGLLFANGRAKPALRHFPRPFFLDARRSRLWGQDRPGGGHTVRIQQRRRATSRYRTIATLRTDGRGTWSRRMRLVPGASYRFVDEAGAGSGTRRR